MSQKELTSKLLTEKAFKTTIGASQEFEGSDDKILEITANVNDYMDLLLTPLVEVPLTPGMVHHQAKQTALTYARAQWYEHLGQVERSRLLFERFKEVREELLSAIRANKPARTVSQFFQRGNALDKLLTPSESFEYVNRIYDGAV